MRNCQVYTSKIERVCDLKACCEFHTYYALTIEFLDSDVAILLRFQLYSPVIQTSCDKCNCHLLKVTFKPRKIMILILTNHDFNVDNNLPD